MLKTGPAALLFTGPRVRLIVAHRAHVTAVNNYCKTPRMKAAPSMCRPLITSDTVNMADRP
jgi:hypothetical protein